MVRVQKAHVGHYIVKTAVRWSCDLRSQSDFSGDPKSPHSSVCSLVRILKDFLRNNMVHIHHKYVYFRTNTTLHTHQTQTHLRT